jgi:hypothetical protein
VIKRLLVARSPTAARLLAAAAGLVVATVQIARDISGRRNALPRALAHRSNNRVDITLSWHADTELLVCVYDARRDVYFEIHPKRDFALDVYYHPYAHVGYGDDGVAA